MKPEVSVIVPVYNVEKYIRNMLESVRKQTFSDFEVLIINDGSTDGSQAIIDEYTFIDNRFKSFVKENGGVASARNMGISLAQGRFLVFYDPDDYIPHNALEKMYAVGKKQDSDMVVGIMEELNMGERLIYMHSLKLAKEKTIDPLDQHFFGAWSLCHKMLKTDFVREHGLQVEDMKNAEDGVFTFCALNFAEKINGCNTIAYNYIKRPFWLSPSATQNLTLEYLKGLLASHQRILQEATKLGRSRLSEEEVNVYLQKLYIRFIEGEMINGYYRGIWRTEDTMLLLIEEKTEEYRKYITVDQWEALVKRHRDLELDKGFMTKEEMASKPLVSIVLGEKFSKEEINLILGSLYRQNFPRFEVIASEGAKALIDEDYLTMANFFLIEGGDNYLRRGVDRAKAQAVMMVDEFVLFSKFTLKQLYGRLESDPSLDFATMMIKGLTKGPSGESYRPLKTMSAAYGYTAFSNRAGKMTEMDLFISNKLFRKSALEGISLGADKREEVRRMYSLMKFSKLRKGFMLTDMTDDDIAEMSGHKSFSPAVTLNYGKNQALDGILSGMKRIITREDIDRVKSYIKRK